MPLIEEQTLPTEHLREFEHPEDPRVIVAPSVEIFRAAARTAQYRAVLLNAEVTSTVLGLPPPAAFSQTLQTVCPEKGYLHDYGSGHLEQNGEIFIQTCAWDNGSLSGIFKNMAALYCEVTWNRRFQTSLGRNLPYTEEHGHHFSVMNVTEDEDDIQGTGWKIAQGRTLYAGIRELAYLKSGFMHLSPNQEPQKIREKKPRHTFMVFHDPNSLY